ncbi:unnamed protein product [Dibothriocephalus latus]|uniref:Protein UNC80 central region domain-containing protein n=1 Tax=Dibothriocephalus latus TaxID=60516 RepID=A0A3P7NPB8_DIBLA|nr:unnamed protein product [Dibothriocephalus latus]
MYLTNHFLRWWIRRWYLLLRKAKLLTPHAYKEISFAVVVSGLDAFDLLLLSILHVEKTFVTASTSRRKQQQELLARAVSAAKAQEDEARRVFHMTTCPVLELASAEAAFSKDHREEAGAEDGRLVKKCCFMNGHFTVLKKLTLFFIYTILI